MPQEIVIAGLIEIAKLGLQTYFTSVRQAGLTKEEGNALFEKEQAKFNDNNPDKLNDVPE